MKPKTSHIEVRQTQLTDVPAVIALCEAVYPQSPPWKPEQLESHLDRFPHGQLVAVERPTDRVVGMASSLIVRWDEYDIDATWRHMTASGWFTNHDPTGRTLYGAEVMVHPELQGHGIGKRLYAARRDIARGLGLLRIRAGARLRGYHRYASDLSPEEYVLRILRGELSDPTLSFQLKQRFRVIAVVEGYLRNDPESLGHAAVIEWINHQVATRDDWKGRDPRFGKPRKTPKQKDLHKTSHSS